MIYSVVDIGTNTVLLLVASIDDAGRITTLEYQQRVPRLGQGVDQHKALRQESMERVINVLLEYRSVIAGHRPETIRICGTSAVRDAANKEEFAELIRRRTGFDLEVLSGEEEALWTYRGAISGIRDIRNATVVDIGGGSTELTRGTSLKIISRRSLDIGSVRLTERLIQHDPPLSSELAGLRSTVRSSLASASTLFAGDPGLVVGVAGTATTLALLVQRRQRFDLSGVSGYILRRDDIRALISRLADLSRMEILNMGDYMEGRNDIITAGGIILEEVMDFLGAEEIIVSERGVRYGIAIREWEKNEKR